MSQHNKSREQLAIELDELRQQVSELQEFRAEEESRSADLLKGLGESLRRRTSVLHSLLDAIAESVIFTDCDGKILALNETAARRLGDSKHITGYCVYEVMAAEIAENRRMRCIEVVNTGKAVSFEERVGAKVYQVAIRPVFGDDGTVQRLAVYDCEVTRRTRMEDSLRTTNNTLQSAVEKLKLELQLKEERPEDEISGQRPALDTGELEKKRFEALCENGPFGLIMISKEGRFLYISRKFKELFGYDSPEISTGRRWFRLAFPDPHYRLNVIRAWKNDLKNIPKGQIRPRIIEVRCKDGSGKIARLAPVELESGEQLIIVEDITSSEQTATKLGQSEERFRALFRNSEGLHLHQRYVISLHARKPRNGKAFGTPRTKAFGPDRRRAFWKGSCSSHAQCGCPRAPRRFSGR